MKFSRFSIIFLFILLIECLALIFQFVPVQFISKPALMLVLIIYFQHNSKKLSPLKHLITLALLFSWFGDILLLIDKTFYNVFIYGLISFLIAHIFYVIYFWQIGKQNYLKRKLKIPILLAVLIYVSGFYFLLFPHLATLKFPVLIYCLIISLMLIASMHAFDFEKLTFEKICIIGTLLFVISDSILAINRFVLPMQFGIVFVMITYAIGQLLIMEGALRNLRIIDLK